MGMTNKQAIVLAINTLSIASQNQSNYVITSHMRDLDYAPAIAKNEFKGKSLKDWS